MQKKQKQKRNRFARSLSWLRANPFWSFLISLIVFVALILIANYSRNLNQLVTEESEISIKEVSLYDIATLPTFNVLTKVRKDNIIIISSQTSAIVQTINVTEGQKVNKGKVLATFTNSYSGSNSASIQGQIAKQTYDLSQSTYNDQLDLIEKQRQIAERSDIQSDELRNITKKSLDGTKSLLLLNETMLSDVRATLATLIAENENGINDSLISQTKQSEIALLSAVENIKSSINQTEYQTADDQEPADLANIGRELTLKQLDIQKKSVETNNQISKLNLKLAQISQEAYSPTSPCSGIIEGIDIVRYSSINPGSQIATIACDNISATATGYVSPEVANSISIDSDAFTIYQNKKIPLNTKYISNETINGIQHRVVFEIPKEMLSYISNDEYIQIHITGTPNVGNVFVPIDSIYQTENESYVLTLEKSGENGYKANATQVSINKIIGNYAYLLTELDTNEKVITTRGILNQEEVKPL